MKTTQINPSKNALGMIVALAVLDARAFYQKHYQINLIAEEITTEDGEGDYIRIGVMQIGGTRSNRSVLIHPTRDEDLLKYKVQFMNFTNEDDVDDYSLSDLTALLRHIENQLINGDIEEDISVPTHR